MLALFSVCVFRTPHARSCTGTIMVLVTVGCDPGGWKLEGSKLLSEKDRISDEKIEAGIGSPVIWFCVALLTYVLSNGPAAWLHEKTSSARLKAGLETLNAARIRAAFTILMLAVIVCACSTHRLAIRIPAHAPAVVFTDGRREHDPGFSGHEQALVGFARRHLVRSRRSAIDAYYRVRHTFDGNE